MHEGTDAPNEPIVYLLAQLWSSISEVGHDLDDDDWGRATDLAGWSVKDCFSHVVGVESSLLGEPMPEADVAHLAHVDGPFAEMIEIPVEARRAVPGPEVLAEFDVCTARRLEVLGALDAEAWDTIGWSPVGQVPYREFMVVRVFDCWMHEQDVRRAAGRPGDLDGPAAELSVGRVRAGMCFVVGKRAGAPEGATVVFEVEGAAGTTFAVVVEGRAHELDTIPDAPTVHIAVDTETFCALGGGRWDTDRAFAAGARVTGDEDLGRRILDAMAITP